MGLGGIWEGPGEGLGVDQRRTGVGPGGREGLRGSEMVQEGQGGSTYKDYRDQP